MKRLLLTIIISALLINNSHAQGCVAIRSTGGLCTMEHVDGEPMKTNGGWMLNVNNRYFKSFRHFVGTEEQKQRIAAGTEVINHAYTLDLALTRIINPRWSIAVDLPIVSNDRSSLYEHGGKVRHHTRSFGLGDIRVATYAWLLDPTKARKGNVQVGLGLKLATGDYKYVDYFYSDTGKALGPVDQSIQLGDGGTGFTTEINAYHRFSRAISVYGNVYYLFSPREQNGVSTARAGRASAANIANGSDVMSVPDQYMVRGGVNFSVDKWTVSGGLRHECIPVHDLIGGSNGFRRPGYVVSAEPGISYRAKAVTFYGFVPVAVERSRTQSVPDKIRTELTGVRAQGDAAFADYSVNIGCSINF